MIFTRFLAIALVVIAVTLVACVEGSLNQNTHVVYTRYVRRKPYRHDKTKFIEEIKEVFHTRRRPPPYYDILNDEERNRFFRCDFDPYLPECDFQGQLSTTRRTQVRPIITTTPKVLLSTISVPVQRPPKTTPKPQPPTTTTTTTSTTTTTTTPTTVSSKPTTSASLYLPPTTPSPQTSTTEELPLLPDIDDDDENDEGPDPNYYDEKENEDETENYVDENQNYDVTDEDANKNDIVLGALTQETTTTVKPKSFFGFF